MPEHLVDLSARIIDDGLVDIATDRITEELSELGDRLAIVESFSHSIVVDTGDGLVVIDTSLHAKGRAVVDAIRGWSGARFHSLVYTHGHLDHVGGSGSFAADADARRLERPTVVSHERVLPRFERYRLTSGYNRTINLRQFGGAPLGVPEGDDRPFLPDSVLEPDVVYGDHLTLAIGDTTFELHHCLGETDDHTWVWVPEHRMIAAGDQFIWRFPNCGNPQKVQRYPLEWAESLRAMASLDAELLAPSHGLPIAGTDRIRGCLLTVAETLERLVFDVVDAMNTGATLDDIVHSVGVSDDVLGLPYMRPLYDEPEFVVRNIWRLYGGWYDGNPARLKPPSDAALGAEVVALAGGVDRLIERAQTLSGDGEHRLACQVIEFAASAHPDSHPVHEARRDIYQARRRIETSVMAKGIYGAAAARSHHAVTGEVPTARGAVQLSP